MQDGKFKENFATRKKVYIYLHLAAAGSKKDIISIAKKHFGEVDGKIGNSFFRSEIADHKIKEHAFG